MKTKLTLKSFWFGLLPLTLCLSAFGQPTIISYQGQLNNGASPANGNFDMTFTFYLGATGGSPLAGPITVNPVAVSNGLFMVDLAVSPSVFNFGVAGAHFLEIGVRTDGSTGAYTVLAPRQLLTQAPYAVAAQTAGSANAVVANSVTAAGIAPGQVVKSLNGLEDAVTLAAGPNITITPNLNGLTISGNGGGGNDWLLTGNAGTTAGLNYVGTSDNQPLELHVNNQRALRLEPDASAQHSPNLIGGSPNNVVVGALGATIGGGGSSSHLNTVTAGYGTVGGGLGNTAGATEATVGGGANNSAMGIDSTVSGGSLNLATNSFATVGGGTGNSATTYASTVGGGIGNTASGPGSVVGGGGYDGLTVGGNLAGGNASVVAGGIYNAATGPYSTIGGGYGNRAGIEGFVGGGDSNAATADDSTVAGGEQNLASAQWAAVSGGSNNTASASAAFVGGGVGNSATNSYAAIGGGFYNIAGNAGTSIGGGYQNKAIGWESTIGGGDVNTASGEDSTVAGGEHNTAGSWHASVGGGTNNIAAAQDSTIAGGENNLASGIGAFVGGGGYDGITVGGNIAGGNACVVGGGNYNLAGDGPTQLYATVGGGFGNHASAFESTVGGGDENYATAEDSTIGGGELNTASGWHVTVGGGYHNSAANQADVISGGTSNTILFASLLNGANAAAGGLGNEIRASQYGAIGGGQGNLIASGATSFTATGCTIPGGVSNIAGGNFSFAAGQQAQAVNDGSFVWADSQNAPFSSVANNEVAFRCAGGVRFTSGGAGFDQTICWTPGSGGWSLCSDRNLKENFEQVDARQVLEKLAQLPLTEWSYKGYSDRHVGPMAQDFHEAFPFNPNDKMLNTADETGVALAAIQGLNQKLEAELKRRDAENGELRSELAELRRMVQLATQTLKGN
jgi:hypothetical protein